MTHLVSRRNTDTSNERTPNGSNRSAAQQWSQTTNASDALRSKHGKLPALSSLGSEAAGKLPKKGAWSLSSSASENSLPASAAHHAASLMAALPVGESVQQPLQAPSLHGGSCSASHTDAAGMPSVLTAYLQPNELCWKSQLGSQGCSEADYKGCGGGAQGVAARHSPQGDAGSAQLSPVNHHAWESKRGKQGPVVPGLQGNLCVASTIARLHAPYSGPKGLEEERSVHQTRVSAANAIEHSGSAAPTEEHDLGSMPRELQPSAGDDRALPSRARGGQETAHARDQRDMGPPQSLGDGAQGALPTGQQSRSAGVLGASRHLSSRAARQRALAEGGSPAAGDQHLAQHTAGAAMGDLPAGCEGRRSESPSHAHTCLGDAACGGAHAATCSGNGRCCDAGVPAAGTSQRGLCSDAQAHCRPATHCSEQDRGAAQQAALGTEGLQLRCPSAQAREPAAAPLAAQLVNQELLLRGSGADAAGASCRPGSSAGCSADQQQLVRFGQAWDGRHSEGQPVGEGSARPARTSFAAARLDRGAVVLHKSFQQQALLHNGSDISVSSSVPDGAGPDVARLKTAQRRSDSIRMNMRRSTSMARPAIGLIAAAADVLLNKGVPSVTGSPMGQRRSVCRSTLLAMQTRQDIANQWGLQKWYRDRVECVVQRKRRRLSNSRGTAAGRCPH